MLAEDPIALHGFGECNANVSNVMLARTASWTGQHSERLLVVVLRFSQLFAKPTRGRHVDLRSRLDNARIFMIGNLIDGR